jgi:hypothetical protein
VIELFRFTGTLPMELPYSEALSLFLRLYYDVFSARFEREIDRPKPWGPAVNYAMSCSLSSLK